MNRLRITVLVLLLILGWMIPYAYSIIQGNYAVSVVDSTNPVKYWTVPGDGTNGMWVNVKTGTLTNITNPVTVQQSDQANLLATVYQPTATNLNMTAAQPSASLLNATVVGNQTNNFAAPGSNNLGVQPAVANAANPTWVEGNEVMLSANLSGAIRVTGNNAGSITSITTIDLDHATIHTGKHFRVVDQQTIASGATFTYLITVPNTAIRAHFDYHVETNTEMVMILYEGPTYGSTGTAITAYNNDRNSATAATVAIYSTPSLTTSGTAISRDLVGGGGAAGRVGNFIESGDEFVLKQNTPYLLGITNNAVGNGIEVIDFGWYEF